MKIITWNINGIRAVEKKGALQSLLDSQSPDIFFMQEIKGTPDKFSPYLIAPDPYQSYYNPAEKPGYSGTGVWIHNRVYEDFDITFFGEFPGDPTANEGRVAHIQLKNKKTFEIFDFFGIYFPNGGKSEDAWQSKLVFYREFSQYAGTLRELGHKVLWGGDINCAHFPIDLARPEANDGKIGFHPLERTWLDTCSDQSWIDIWRTKNPNVAEVYSWWDQVTRARDRNVGWRIDAIWGDSEIFAKTRHIEYLHTHMGSDHCPLLLDLDIS